MDSFSKPNNDNDDDTKTSKTETISDVSNNDTNKSNSALEDKVDILMNVDDSEQSRKPPSIETQIDKAQDGNKINDSDKETVIKTKTPNTEDNITNTTECYPLTTEHSEDSNTHQSETEQGKETQTKTTTSSFETDSNAENAMDSFSKPNNDNDDDIKTSKTETISDVSNNDTNKSNISALEDKVDILMDVDDSEQSRKSPSIETQIDKAQDGNKINDSDQKTVIKTKTPNTEDNITNTTESYPLTTENSEDSNTHQSETEQGKETQTKTTTSSFETDANAENAMDSFSKPNNDNDDDTKTSKTETISDDSNNDTNKSNISALEDKVDILMNVDDSEQSRKSPSIETQIDKAQDGNKINDSDQKTVIKTKTPNTEDNITNTTESYPLTTEHSEDSNTHQSETEQGKETQTKTTTSSFETDSNAENAMDSFSKPNNDNDDDTKTSKTETISDDSNNDTNKSNISALEDKVDILMDVDDSEQSRKPPSIETQIDKAQDGNKINDSDQETVIKTKTPNTEDNITNTTESYPLTTEHSEDSNTHQSETEQGKETQTKTTTSSFETDANAENAMDSFSKPNNDNDDDTKTSKTETISDDSNNDTNKSNISALEDKVDILMDVDNSEQSRKPPSIETQIDKAQDGNKINDNDKETVIKTKTPNTEDNITNTTGNILLNLLRDGSGKKTKSCDQSEVIVPRGKLQICEPKNVVNIVDLEESSSDDDVKIQTSATDKDGQSRDSGATAKEVPTDTDGAKIDQTIMPNTIEVSNIKDGSAIIVKRDKQELRKELLEIFNLDSDDDEKLACTDEKPKDIKQDQPKSCNNNKCCNQTCSNTDSDVSSYVAAPQYMRSYYQITNKHSKLICNSCYQYVSARMFSLLEDYKDMKPLSEMDVEEHSQELVEISDSDSDTDDSGTTKRKHHVISADDIGYLEKMQLDEIMEETWKKYNLDDRLKAAKHDFDEQILDLENESKKIDEMFKDCQTKTDSLRQRLYSTYAENIHELDPIHIVDPEFVPTLSKLPPIKPEEPPVIFSDVETRRSQRTKKPVIPPADQNTSTTTPTTANPVDDDNSDISVVKLSAESAPPDLPPPGELIRHPPRCGDPVYIMRNSNVNGSWVRAKIVEQMQKGSFPGVSSYFTVFKVRIDKASRGSFMKFVHGKQVAYYDPAPVRLSIGTRVISLFKNSDSHIKRESYYSGIVAEMPNPVNNYRYLIFFDDGYAQYVSHSGTRAVCENSPRVWEDVHQDSADFLRKYLIAYPERPMVRLHAGQMLKTEWNGKWWNSKVLTVDASLVKVYFDSDDRTEWIYRGSTRLLPLFLELQAAERHRPRGLTRAYKLPGVKNMPYVEYTRSDEQTNKQQAETHQQEERKQRAVAKKSTTSVPTNITPALDTVTSRVVFYTPKSAIKPYKMTTHTCSPRCKRSELLSLKELRTYNPLARPLLSGWERVIVRFKGRKIVMYRTPCGRRLRNMPELHRYLQLIDSEMGVDLFDFCPDTHCLSEFVLNRCNVSKKDLSHGKENVPVPCVNYYDTSLPEFCSYNTERTPTAGVPLNLDPEFLCGCDCTDDCQDKTKCACWKMTLEGAKTIGLEGHDLGYVYRRLPDPLPSGIFECNSRCSCRNTCLNRVAQHPLQLKLQVFKTLNRGWGIRALNDIPKGAFLCVYAGNLLTDATANLDGLNEGDEYLAELDYIEVVEQMKEGYEEDIPEADKEKDKKDSNTTDEDEEETDSAEESKINKEEEDDDFRPAIEPIHNNMFSKRLRKREKKKEEAKRKNVEQKKPDAEDDCITISDDEDVRKPSCFTAQAGMDGDYVPKYKSVRTLFGKDEACYIMDAKVQGNIGRYLNHSCTPNVFVQNVFVDTHDPRFPWVAFFALRPIGAGTELTWNYNYDVGSVPGKLMYCYCGAPNCRGRLL